VAVSAGGGAVKVKINGKQEILSIKINPDVVDLHDVAGLEEVVTLAVNNAIKDSQSMVQKAMSSITGGMNIPGLF
jgi:DNA-binding YbaB/EbfC family protein